MKRISIIIEWRGGARNGYWVMRCRYDGDGRRFATQAMAVDAGRAKGRAFWAKRLPAELRIRKRNGQWSSKGSTYGKDPRRTRG